MENSLRVLDILAKIDPALTVSLMSQYFPVHKAGQFPEVNRLLTQDEFDEVCNHLDRLGFTNGWVQDYGAEECFVPDFNRGNPFDSPAAG
jgi:putative pyruvate formate lyase activating enzyme